MIKEDFEKILTAFESAKELDFAKNRSDDLIYIFNSPNIAVNGIIVNCGLCFAIKTFDHQLKMKSYIDKYKPKNLWNRTGWFYHPYDIDSRIEILKKIISDLK